jgi:hypothetical protein
MKIILKEHAKKRIKERSNTPEIYIIEKFKECIKLIKKKKLRPEITMRDYKTANRIYYDKMIFVYNKND